VAVALFLVVVGSAVVVASGPMARWFQERQPPLVAEAWGGGDVIRIATRLITLGIGIAWIAAGVSELS
jgi:hypothetical protein